VGRSGMQTAPRFRVTCRSLIFRLSKLRPYSSRSYGAAAGTAPVGMAGTGLGTSGIRGPCSEPVHIAAAGNS
jgi:hypothetical protein